LAEGADDLEREGADVRDRNPGSGGVGLAGEGILDRDDEDAVELVESGERQDGEGLENLAEAFVVEEEEEPVFADGAAEVETVLVAIEGGLLEGDDDAGAAGVGGLEEACGVEVGVAEELVEGGMILVGSAVGGHVDGGAGGASVLGALVIGDDLELGDGVGRDGDDLVVEALVGLSVGVVVETVEQEVVEHGALAVDVVGSGADEGVDGAGGGGGRSLAGAGDETEEVGVVAADEGQGGGLVASDDLAALAGLGLDLESDVGDFDGGGGRADLQGEVDARTSTDGNGDVVSQGV
jgi:hypothetical protein